MHCPACPLTGMTRVLRAVKIESASAEVYSAFLLLLMRTGGCQEDMISGVAQSHTSIHGTGGGANDWADKEDQIDCLGDVVRTKYVPLSDDSDDESEEAEYERKLMLKYGLLRH